MELIGLISDTHDYLDPKVPSFFRGVSHIIHAGDVGRPRILLELEQMAPSQPFWGIPTMILS